MELHRVQWSFREARQACCRPHRFYWCSMLLYPSASPGQSVCFPHLLFEQIRRLAYAPVPARSLLTKFPADCTTFLIADLSKASLSLDTQVYANILASATDIITMPGRLTSTSLCLYFVHTLRVLLISSTSQYLEITHHQSSLCLPLAP